MGKPVKRNTFLWDILPLSQCFSSWGCSYWRMDYTCYWSSWRGSGGWSAERVWWLWGDKKSALKSRPANWICQGKQICLCFLQVHSWTWFNIILVSQFYCLPLYQVAVNVNVLHHCLFQKFIRLGDGLTYIVCYPLCCDDFMVYFLFVNIHRVCLSWHDSNLIFSGDSRNSIILLLWNHTCGTHRFLNWWWVILIIECGGDVTHPKLLHCMMLFHL